MSETSYENIGQELTDLHRQLGELRNQVENYYNEALEWKAKRDELNKSVSQLVSKLKEEREQRRHANEKVAELKVFKEEFNKELEEKNNLIDTLEEKKKESLASVRDNPEYLGQKIKRLEWFMQTNVLSLSEENELVKEISALEKKVLGTKVIDDIDSQLSQVSGKARAIQCKVKEYRTQMLEHVRTSQSHHATIIALAKKVSDLKKEADSAHEKYLELFDLASQALSNSKKIQDRIRELTDKIKLQKESKNTDRIRDFEEKIEKVAVQAVEKLKKGSRITMDELSVLVERGFFNEAPKP